LFIDHKDELKRINSATCNNRITVLSKSFQVTFSREFGMKFDELSEIEKFVRCLPALDEQKTKFVFQMLGVKMNDLRHAKTISNFIVIIESENNFRSGFMQTDSKMTRIYFGLTEAYLRSKMFNAEVEEFYQMVEIDKYLGLYHVRDTVYLLLYYFNYDIIITSNIVQDIDWTACPEITSNLIFFDSWNWKRRMAETNYPLQSHYSIKNHKQSLRQSHIKALRKIVWHIKATCDAETYYRIMFEPNGFGWRFVNTLKRSLYKAAGEITSEERKRLWEEFAKFPNDTVDLFFTNINSTAMGYIHVYHAEEHIEPTGVIFGRKPRVSVEPSIPGILTTEWGYINTEGRYNKNKISL
jgi:hypothetical protein